MNTHSSKQKLTWRDRLLVIRAGFWIPVVEIWMRTRGFQHCQRGLRKIAAYLPTSGGEENLSRAQHIAALVEKGNRRCSPYIADCLTRSLVLQYILHRKNIEADLKLGVRTLTGQFEAHSWVEYKDTPLGEQESVRQIYTAFDWTRTPSSAAKR